MPGTFLFNSVYYNSLAYFVDTSETNLIIFNEYALHNGTTHIVQKLKDDNIADRDLTVDKIPRGNGGFIVKDNDRSKVIEMIMRISADTADELEAELHALRRAIVKQNGSLLIRKDSGEVIEYIATLQNGSGIINREHYHRTFVPISLSFLVVDGRGRLEDYTVQDYFSQTDLEFQDDFVHDGSSEAKPVYILSFSAAVGVTEIEIENETTGKIITITEAISAGDYVRVDVENAEVTINGALVNYAGVFPELQAGSNSIRITIAGTSATYTLTVKHRKTYL